jgi:hypothetical protein
MSLSALRTGWGRAVAAALLATFAVAGPANALIGEVCAHHFPAATAAAHDGDDLAQEAHPSSSDRAAHCTRATPHDHAADHASHRTSVVLPGDAAAHSANAVHGHNAPGHDEDSPCGCLGQCAPVVMLPALERRVDHRWPEPFAAAPEFASGALLLTTRQPYLIPFANGPPSPR